ncbi:acyloxyacyl hydrolase [Hyphomonas sp.]|uniref:acyloxyacyl hydrolase n=1 Tax=Hyphomonas sp. TaxID=87 RepID=UPI003D2AC569|tara:strand:+ start:20741 stop:21319 length:579 start_codon:yes stop_codon:yes gene_type:complete
MHRVYLSILASFAMAGTAFADLLDEARVGVMQHNVCVTDCNNADKEDGPNISAELVFKSPDFLSVVLAPRPYVMGSLNTSGNTSYGAAGLIWNFSLTERLSFEPGVGYALHDGALESPFPQGDPQGDAFTSNHVLLGSEDLFRTSLALNYAISDRWGAQVLYEHLSHGQILGNGRNQGLDNVGLRVTYALGN